MQYTDSKGHRYLELTGLGGSEEFTQPLITSAEPDAFVCTTVTVFGKELTWERVGLTRDFIREIFNPFSLPG